MKVTLNDFQILEGTNTFEFLPGINVIVGPNASGKSSLFYAIENCLMNPNGVSDCINYNSSKTSVTIEENNNSITWIRTPDSCCYVNNKTGQQYVKASKLDSRDVADLKFYFDAKGKVVNIHNEWSVLFPFAESDADMFRLFEDIFNISSSFQIIDEMKKDEQNVKSEILNLQQQKMDYARKVTTIDTIFNTVSIDKLTEFSSALDDLFKVVEDITNNYNLYKQHLWLTEVTVPEKFDLFSLYNQADTLETLKKDYDTYTCSLKITPIDIPIAQFDLNNTELEDIKNIYKRYCTIMTTIKETTSQLIELEQEKEVILQKISQIKVCPTCGQEIGEDRWKI